MQPKEKPVSNGYLTGLARSSVMMIRQWGSWPFGIVRGQGNFGVAALYFALGVFATGVVQSVIFLILNRGNPGWWQPIVFNTISWVAGWSMAVLYLDRQLNLGAVLRAELAGALAIGWVPVIFVVSVLQSLLSGVIVASGITISPFSATSVLMIVGLMLVSQKAVRMLFRPPFEESFVPVGMALIFNAIVQEVVMYGLIKLWVSMN
jgi:hypothetical protein